MLERQWWYYVDEPNITGNVGPFNSREAAAAAAFKAQPERREVNTGYGAGGAYFDIQWPRNPNWKPEED